MSNSESRKRSIDEMVQAPSPSSISLKPARVNYQLNNHLLMSSITGLNRSAGKFVLTGLDLSSDGLFYPTVLLVDNKFRGVTLSSSAWSELCDEMENIMNYFEKGVKVFNNSTKNRYKCKGFSYSYITLHKNRTLVIHQNEDENIGSDEESDTQQPIKKVRMCEPCIYLQSTTFCKLMNVSSIVNMRLKKLKSSLSAVHECKSLITDALQAHVPTIEHMLGKGAMKTNTGRIVLQDLMKRKTDNGETVLWQTIRENITPENYTDNIDLILCEIFNLFEDEIIDAVVIN